MSETNAVGERRNNAIALTMSMTSFHRTRPHAHTERIEAVVLIPTLETASPFTEPPRTDAMSHSESQLPRSNGETSAESLFSPSLISPTVSSALPEGYSMRPLQRSDFDLGFLDVLRVLTHVGDVTKPEFEKQFDAMKAGASTYHVLVILDGEGKIVGTGALIVERKL